MKKLLLIAIAMAVFTSCKKEDDIIVSPQPKTVSYNSVVKYEVICETCEMEIPRWIKVHPFISICEYGKFEYAVQDNKEALITIYTASKKSIPFTFRLYIDGVLKNETNSFVAFGNPYSNVYSIY